MDADGFVEFGADEFVLFGLDGGDDVAHGSDAGSFDFFEQDLADGLLFAAAEVFVFEAGQFAFDEAEAAASLYVLWVFGAGLVELAG
ncbi:hypothetical protein GCM10010399_43310 [Dactylosporangium fulvum]